MGKKRIRKSITSKGERRNVAANITAAVKRDTSPIDKALHKLAAWRAGKNPWITVANGSRGTNQPFIKVRANSYYGDPKFAMANIFGKRTEA